jgi:hypothetical protein
MTVLIHKNEGCIILFRRGKSYPGFVSPDKTVLNCTNCDCHNTRRYIHTALNVHIYVVKTSTKKIPLRPHTIESLA